MKAAEPKPAAVKAAERPKASKKKQKLRRREVPKVAAAAIEAAAPSGLKKKNRNEVSALPSPKKPKVEGPPPPYEEPSPKVSEAHQKRLEKQQKQLEVKMAEILSQEALNKLTKDKTYKTSEFFFAIRKPEQTNKETNKQD